MPVNPAQDFCFLKKRKKVGKQHFGLCYKSRGINGFQTFVVTKMMVNHADERAVLSVFLDESLGELEKSKPYLELASRQQPGSPLLGATASVQASVYRVAGIAQLWS